MHVPSGCPLADLERPTDMGDDLARRARPIDGVPDLGRDGVQAQDLALIEIEENRLSLDDAPPHLVVLGEASVCGEDGRLRREGLSKNAQDGARVQKRARDTHDTKEPSVVLERLVNLVLVQIQVCELSMDGDGPEPAAQRRLVRLEGLVPPLLVRVRLSKPEMREAGRRL